MADLATRVLVVGSGVAGSLVARTLLDKGYSSVTVLDAGPGVLMRDQRNWYDYVTNGNLPYTSLYDLPADYTATGVVPWQVTGGRIFGRGGSTLHWGGWAPRFKPEDFKLRTNTGQGLDWPYDYDALEPWYCKAEDYLQVAGDSQAPPRRSRPFPFPAATYPELMGPVIDALRKLDWSYQHLPLARNTNPIAGRPACVTIGTCDYCPIGARFTGDQPLDALQPRSGFRLVLQAAARRLLMDGKKRVRGVEYLDVTSGTLRTVEAEWVFLCAGALETPKLLLASTTPEWPRGVGNETDLVGRFLIASPFIFAGGTAPVNPRKLQAELNFPTLTSRQWDTPAQQAQGTMMTTVNYNLPFLDPAALMNANKPPAAIEAASVGPLKYQVWGSLLEFSHAENRVTLESGSTRFGLPRTRIETPRPTLPEGAVARQQERLKSLLTAMNLQEITAAGYPQRGDHAMCTTRMSASAADGVVTPELRVHGVDNLYVVSNAVLPSGSAANPTLTMVAAALKALDSFPRP